MGCATKRRFATCLATCFVAAGLATGAAPTTAAPQGVKASRLHDFEGPIVHINRDRHRFKVRDHHHGKVRIKANSRTEYEHLSGFGALHKGLRVEVEAKRKNGRWIAVEIERELRD